MPENTFLYGAANISQCIRVAFDSNHTVRVYTNINFSRELHHIKGHFYNLRKFEFENLHNCYGVGLVLSTIIVLQVSNMLICKTATNNDIIYASFYKMSCVCCPFKKKQTKKPPHPKTKYIIIILHKEERKKDKQFSSLSFCFIH